MKELAPELKLGFMTDEEMALWCGKSLTAYKKNRARWAEKKLIQYATFNLKRGGIEILSIKEPIYSASGRKEVFELWRECWGYDGNLLDTNKDCWLKTKEKMVNNIADVTGCNYVSQAKCENYGTGYGNKRRDGKIGYCHYVFCKIVDGKPQHFTEAELKIKEYLEEKYLANRKDITYKMQALKAAKRLGDITESEYCEAMDELLEYDRDWNKYYSKLEEAVGCPVDFRQELVDDIVKITNLKLQASQVENESFDF